MLGFLVDFLLIVALVIALASTGAYLGSGDDE